MPHPTLKAAAALALAGLPLVAHAETDEARLRKLEQAVSLLQQENAALKQTLNGSAAADAPPAPINKVKLSDSVTEMRIYGEGRLRYFFNDGESTGLDARDHADRERLRYRLRLGADIKVHENWMLGVMLEENNSARSSNVTLGENPVFAKGTVTKGDFVSNVGNDRAVTRGSVVTNVNFGDALFLGRVFLKYDPINWLTMEVGKIANPFVTTRMVWDPDISPEGAAEQFHYTLGPWGHSTPLADKDGKGGSPVNPGGLTVDLFANFAQFIYDDVGFENSFNSGNGPFTTTPSRSDRWLLGYQLGARATWNKNAYVQVAPAFYHYTGGGNNSAGPFNGDSPLVILNSKAKPELITFNQTGTNDLAFIEVPVEIGGKIGNLPVSLFGDFSYNFSADERAEKAGHDDKSAAMAYQIGASIGSNKKKGDWELRGWWQHSEAFALDQNIIDDDIFDGRLNMEGFFAQASYNLTDSVSFILQYSHGQRIDQSLGTPGFGSLGTPSGFPLENTNLFYVDLNLKF